MANYDNLPMEMRTYVKSNEMISAKYRSTLLENQVMAIALTRIEENKDDPDAPLEARLYPGELKRLISDERHIYRDLQTLAKAITGHTMFLEDGKGNFSAFSLIPNATYQDGVFTIIFNPVLKEHLRSLDKNFTTLELSVMTNFEKNSAFRIYELLKKDLFRSKSNVNSGRVDVEYDLYEFRFLIGVANSDNIHVRNRIKTMKVIDWEELYHILEENGSKQDIKFREVDRLRRDCIIPAQLELRRKSDIQFDFEFIRCGRWYKKIVFHIFPNTPENEQEVLTRQQYIESIGKSERQMEIPIDLSNETRQLYDKYVGHNGLDKEDIDLLLKKAHLQVRDVEDAIRYTDNQDEINNYMGYLVRCIENRYFESEVVPVAKGSADKAEAIRELREAAYSEKTGKELWERTKKKDDFEKFLAYEERSKDISLDVLDELYTPGEAVKEYIEWTKIGRP